MENSAYEIYFSPRVENDGTIHLPGPKFHFAFLHLTLTSDLNLDLCFRWIIQAMKLQLNYENEKAVSLSAMPPSVIKSTLYRTLKKHHKSEDKR